MTPICSSTIGLGGFTFACDRQARALRIENSAGEVTRVALCAGHARILASRIEPEHMVEVVR